VLEDATADEVVVQYKDGRGVSRRRIFPRSKQGRKDAIAWGETYHEERSKGHGGTPETTHQQLWKAYMESPAFQSRRAKTRQNYAERWRKWMHFRGERTKVDETTLLHVDQFYAARKAAGRSANQTRGIIAVARIVYSWGQTRKLVTVNELALYRWHTAEGEEAQEPEEYTETEFLAVLAQLPPQSHRHWRAHVALMLAGHQGIRANAVLHLAWADTHPGEALFIWPAVYQKNRRDFPQPMTWDAVAALETARYWRDRLGYEGPWVLFAGGGAKPIGSIAHGNARHGRKERTAVQDTAYTYQALWVKLMAEKAAGVAHKPRRALHGFRKMVAGNVSDRTGDDRLGMQFIGDRDMKQAKRYLKRRDERMERAATSVETKAPPGPPVTEQTTQDLAPTVPELSPNENAPAGALGSADVS
jgi:integrase